MAKNTKKLENARMRGGGCRGFQGSRGSPVLGGKTLKHEKTRKTLQSCNGWATTQQHPGFCAGGSSRTNGSGACHGPPPHFKVLGGGKGEVKPPKFPTRQPRVGGFKCKSIPAPILKSKSRYIYIYIYTHVYTYVCVCICSCLHLFLYMFIFIEIYV